MGKEGEAYISVKDSVKKLDKIFNPPPRFAFGGCYHNTKHAPNTRLPTHSSFAVALTEHVRQRNSITKHINNTKAKNFEVLNLLSTLTPSQQNQADKASTLKKITHQGNVHLTEMGYKLLAGKIVEVAKELKDRQIKHHQQSQPEDPLSGREIISWGGFYTTVGCCKKSELKAPGKRASGLLRIGGKCPSELAHCTCHRSA